MFLHVLVFFRHAELENAIPFFFDKFEILLILIFKISFSFLDWMNYPHNFFYFRRCGRVKENAASSIPKAHKNCAPFKDCVNIITST